MAVEGDIRTSLADLVSGRCWPLLAPLNAQAPYITYQVISMVPDMTLKGPNGLKNSRVQIDCVADTYPEVKALAIEVSDTLDTDFVQVVMLGGHDTYDEESKRYGFSQDFSFWHR